MNNVIVFGPVQSGKSTLMGYIATSYLSDKLFSIEAYEIDKRIRKLGIADVKNELILPGFLSLDRDELIDTGCFEKNSIGTTKRVHRKRIHFESNESFSSGEFTFVDTPGIRDYRGDQYGCMFEGNIGLYVVSAIDIQQFLCLGKEAKNKRASEKRRLFSALQFWSDYKGADKLLVALTKTDMISAGQEELERIYDIFSEMIAEITGQSVQVIPTSVLLHLEEGVFKRDEHNVLHPSVEMEWYHGPTLISALNEKTQHLPKSQSRVFRLAAVRQIRKIPNSSSVALQMQCVYGGVGLSDRLILGPVKDKAKQSVFLQGTVKSLKIEDGPLVNMIPEGVIGGVAFKTLSVYGGKTANVDLKDYRIIPTTVLISGKTKAGNIVTMRIREDEIGGMASQAISQLKPKGQIRFYWLGKAINGDLIELYHEDGYLYLSLANLTDIVNHKENLFVVPDMKDLHDLEAEILAELRFTKYNFSDDRLESFKTHLLFRVSDIKNIGADSVCTVLFYPANYYSAIQEIQDVINEPSKKRTQVVLDNGKKAVVFNQIEINSLPDCYRTIRRITTYAGIYSYNLVIETR